MEETAGMTETKKILDNPRVEIDTSPPFESVKEAVDWFSGSGPWIQHNLLRLAAHHHHETEPRGKMEEYAVQLETDLMLKEQETLKLLKQLEAAKRLVETLKCHLKPEFCPFLASTHQNLETRTNDSTEDLSLFPVLSPGLMFMELNHAKMNLNKTSVDLAVIQESVESLNKKMRRDGALLERRMEMEASDCGKPKAEVKGRLENCTNIAVGLERADFESEQFKNMTEASRYEVMAAMAEIERTKNSIKMVEMRLNAAKKMEEAAKAVEEIALAERSLTSSDVFLDHKRNGITLSFEEYRSLTQKAHRVEEICKTKFIDANTIQTRSKDHQSEVASVTEKNEEMKKENQHSRVADLRTKEEGSLPNDQDRYSKFKFRNSRSGGHRTAQAANENGLKGTTSTEDILSRKLIINLQNDIIVGKHVEDQHGERGHVSLSQMLREQSRTILHPGETTGDERGRVERSFFVQTKKFGFIQVPISIKKTKKKVQT
ncbi:WEB family protein At2g40480-like [Primulina eburnea]|uniref:WEB family protein At2g40480-like n=1 Tax=Primulina eburnea TaxID=1245227 RepID=UPI003C6C579F